MFLTVIIFILILGVLVLVHEAGHFFVAKRNGVRADEFGFGYPPRVFGFYKNKDKKKKVIFGNKPVEEIKDIEKGKTVFSLNWIPIGGFVKIHGEDGENKKDPESFASKSIWKRFKILFAGSGMNLISGIVFLAIALQLGLPQQVDDLEKNNNAKVQIVQVSKGTPAEEAGINFGDIIIDIDNGEEKVDVNTVAQVQEVISANKGQEIILTLEHPGQEGIFEKKVFIREEYPDNQGPTGIMLARVAEKKYGFFQSFWMAIVATYSMIVTILWFLWDLIASIFTENKVDAEVAGPVGIAVLTGEMARMGIAYLFNFAAILSINLAVINLLPFPALDGGRIFFLIIEKIKGSPISQKAEGIIHTAGFFVLISLMILVTVKDFVNFEIIGKIKGLF